MNINRNLNNLDNANNQSKRERQIEGVIVKSLPQFCFYALYHSISLQDLVLQGLSLGSHMYHRDTDLKNLLKIRHVYVHQ